MEIIDLKCRMHHTSLYGLGEEQIQHAIQEAFVKKS